MATASDWPNSGPQGQTARKKLSFDPTINAGHVLTAVITLAGALSAGMAAWTSIDKRLNAIEMDQRYGRELQSQKDANQDIAIRESMVRTQELISHIRSDIKDLKDATRK
jgi:hypothetical protein